MQHNKRGYFSAISGCTEVSCLDQLDAIVLLARHQPYLSRASNSESRFSADQIVLPVIPTPRTVLAHPSSQTDYYLLRSPGLRFFCLIHRTEIATADTVV
jgi:hypothetical protein